MPIAVAIFFTAFSVLRATLASLDRTLANFNPLPQGKTLTSIGTMCSLVKNSVGASNLSNISVKLSQQSFNVFINSSFVSKMLNPSLPSSLVLKKSGTIR